MNWWFNSGLSGRLGRLDPSKTSRYVANQTLARAISV